jgi:hypothetical protein
MLRQQLLETLPGAGNTTEDSVNGPKAEGASKGDAVS